MASNDNLNMNKAVTLAINTFVASVGQGRLRNSVDTARKREESNATNKLLEDANAADNAKLSLVLYSFANHFVFEMNLLYHEINNTGNFRMQSGLVNGGSTPRVKPVYELLHSGKRVFKVSRRKKSKDAFHAAAKQFLVKTLNSSGALHSADPLLDSWKVKRGTSDNYYLNVMRNATILLTGFDIKKTHRDMWDACVDSAVNPGSETFNLKTSLAKYCEINNLLGFEKVKVNGSLNGSPGILSGQVLQDAPGGKHLILFEIKPNTGKKSYIFLFQPCTGLVFPGVDGLSFQTGTVWRDNCDRILDSSFGPKQREKDKDNFKNQVSQHCVNDAKYQESESDDDESSKGKGGKKKPMNRTVPLTLKSFYYLFPQNENDNDSHKEDHAKDGDGSHNEANDRAKDGTGKDSCLKNIVVSNIKEVVATGSSLTGSPENQKKKPRKSDESSASDSASDSSSESSSLPFPELCSKKRKSDGSNSGVSSKKR